LLPKYLFVSLFVLFFILFTYFGIKRFINRLEIDGTLKKILGIGAVINLLAVFGYMLHRKFDIESEGLFYLLSVAVGFGFLLFVFALFYELITFTLYITKHSKYKKHIDITILSIFFASLVFGVANGLKTPEVTEVSVDLEHLDTKIKGVMISDLHIGGVIDEMYVKNTVQKINQEHPDIVLLVGDIIDDEFEKVSKIALLLKDIKAKHGIYLSLGNHEMFHHPQKWVDFFKEIGINVLVNENITIEIDGKKVTVAGASDHFGKEELKLDIDKTLHNASSPVILMAHQPSIIEDLGEKKVDMILSGHTHGGQIFPFGTLVKIKQPILYGLHRLENKSWIFVSSGAGYWGPPMRLGTKSEIVVLNLY